MKIIFFLCFHIFISCLSQSFERKKDCTEFINSLNGPYFEKKEKPSFSFKKIQIKKEDSANTVYYKGIIKQFDKKDYLIAKPVGVSMTPNNCISNIYPDWTTIELFSKTGTLIKRTLVFYNKINAGENYIFNKQHKAIYTRGLGDVLFKMKIEDFIKILEKNNITPQTTKMRTENGGNISIYKHITPAGSFWEYQLMFRDNLEPSAMILISDTSRKILAKSYDITPKIRNTDKENNYLDIRDSILNSENSKFNLKENEILTLLEKGNYKATSYIIKKYIKKTWLVQTDSFQETTKPIMLLIDDTSGKVLIDISNYSKDIYGEEKFIKDFNELLLKKSN